MQTIVVEQRYHLLKGNLHWKHTARYEWTIRYKCRSCNRFASASAVYKEFININEQSVSLSVSQYESMKPWCEKAHLFGIGEFLHDYKCVYVCFYFYESGLE